MLQKVQFQEIQHDAQKEEKSRGITTRINNWVNLISLPSDLQSCPGLPRLWEGSGSTG